MSASRCWLSAKRGVMVLFSGHPAGVRGLSNHCLSCCVNTLLQTFSATGELAELLAKWDAAGVRSDGRNVPLELKKVLAAMRRGLPEPAPHDDFLRCLDRNCIRRNTQHDADEVFLFILNSLQQQVDDAALASEIKTLYKISVETQLRCLVCSSVQTHSSYLLTLPLHINEHHNSLTGCLASFFEPQELRDSNSCYCPNCESKTPTKQGVKLLSLPHILCVNLKRFRNRRGRTQKLDCAVVFPETFDFDSETVKEAFPADVAQNHCKYRLYAVVVHSGNAMCGHYTAFVRLNQCWYYADDSHVKQVSWDEVKKTYGGSSGDTAYMLMYRRVSNGQQPDLSG